MIQLLKLTATPAAALLALALASITAPVAAGPNEYCRTDVSSAMRSYSFASMEQCQAMSVGRGGSCACDPFLTEIGTDKTSTPYAFQLKAGPHRTKPPVR
jgi:hypothetical protein